MLCQINPLFWLIESLYWRCFDNAKQLFNNHFLKTNGMKKLFSVFVLSLCFSLFAVAQESLIFTSFEGPGFDEGWTTGVSQGIELAPQPYPATGLQPWEQWSLTDPQGGFGYVHSGDSAAWIGGTLYLETKHDWLMTPKFDVPTGGSTLIKYWLWYHSEMSYVNKFYIMVYDFGTEKWEQGYLLANEFNSPYHYIEEYTFDLSQWSGKSIKVAFVKNGTYQMAMDDISIANYQSLEAIENANLKIYPNPTTNKLTIENAADVMSIRIVDMYGRQVAVVPNTGGAVLDMDVSNLPEGNYVVNLRYKNLGNVSRLITKQ